MEVAMTKFRPFAFFVVAVCSGQLALGQDWHKPYEEEKEDKKSTLGSQLETEFKTLLSSCNVIVPLRKTTRNFLTGGAEKQGEKISAIHHSLQGNALSLNAKLLGSVQHSIGRLFFYVYKEQDTNEVPKLELQRLISYGDYTQAPDRLIIPGGAQTIYTQSCSSIISAA